MLDAERAAHYGRRMSRQPRGPRTKDIEKELANIGGEPLEDSGFEDETPEPEFSEKAPVEAEAPH